MQITSHVYGITIIKLSLPRRAVEVVALELSPPFFSTSGAAGGDGVVGGGGNGSCGVTAGSWTASLSLVTFLLHGGISSSSSETYGTQFSRTGLSI